MGLEQGLSRILQSHPSRRLLVVGSVVAALSSALPEIVFAQEIPKPEPQDTLPVPRPDYKLIYRADFSRSFPSVDCVSKSYSPNGPYGEEYLVHLYCPAQYYMLTHRDAQNPFMSRLKVRKESGDNFGAMGMVMVTLDETIHRLMIASNGAAGYLITPKEGRDTLVDTGVYPAINQGSASNDLLLTRDEQGVRFAVNGVTIFKTPSIIDINTPVKVGLMARTQSALTALSTADHLTVAFKDFEIYAPK